MPANKRVKFNEVKASVSDETLAEMFRLYRGCGMYINRDPKLLTSVGFSQSSANELSSKFGGLMTHVHEKSVSRNEALEIVRAWMQEPGDTKIEEVALSIERSVRSVYLLVYEVKNELDL